MTVYAKLMFGVVVLTAGAVTAPFASADTEIRRPLPGTNTPDYGGPLLIERNGIVYPAIPGTRTPDYGSADRRIIRDGKVYDAIPGTNTPDYGSGLWLLRERRGAGTPRGSRRAEIRIRIHLETSRWDAALLRLAPHAASTAACS